MRRTISSISSIKLGRSPLSVFIHLSTSSFFSSICLFIFVLSIYLSILVLSVYMYLSLQIVDLLFPPGSASLCRKCMRRESRRSGSRLPAFKRSGERRSSFARDSGVDNSRVSFFLFSGVLLLSLFLLSLCLFLVDDYEHLRSCSLPFKQRRSKRRRE